MSNTYRHDRDNSVVKKIILILYIISLSLGIYANSTFSWANEANFIRRLSIFLLGIMSLVLLNHTLKQYVFLVVGVFVTGYSYIINRASIEYLIIVIIIFSLSIIEPKIILKYSIIFILSNLLVLVICSKIGLISNLLFYRDGVLRQSLGTIYPLAFAAYVFFLCGGYVAINYGKSKILLQISILIIASIFLLKINGARNDSILTLLMIGSVLSVYIPKRFNKTISIVGTVIVFFLSILSIFITKISPYTTNLYDSLNVIFNGRLQFQYMLFTYYKPQFFGQLIPEIGLGGSQAPVLNYFYIDNSYTKMLFMAGIAFTIFMYCILIALVRRLINNDMYKLVYIILIVILAGIGEDSFINSSMNIFFTIFITSNGLLLKGYKENLQ